MRYLALDIGTKRTGLAVSDATGLIARPYDVIPGGGDARALLAALAPILEEEEVEAIVIGLPLNQTGPVGGPGRSAGPGAKAREFPVGAEIEQGRHAGSGPACAGGEQ